MSEIPITLIVQDYSLFVFFSVLLIGLLIYFFVKKVVKKQYF